MRKKLLWGFMYTVIFALSTVFGSVVITDFTTGDGGLSKIKWDHSVGTIQKDFSYGDKQSNKFDLYLPANRSKKNYGLVVYTHGGGFTGGDKADDSDILKWIASKGYVGAGVNYTLIDKDSNHLITIYEITEEIKKAIPIVIQQANKSGYSINKMATGGGSAGSLLAMVYAYRDSKNSSIPLVFTFQASGPTLTEPKNFGITTDIASYKGIKEQLNFFNGFLGVDVTEQEIKNKNYKEKIKSVSPTLLINKHSAPILFAHGKEDRIVPYQQAESLLNVLNNNNISYDFIEFKKSGHRLNWQPKKMTEFINKLSDYLNKYMPIN
ncbi:prolyl oligopeptidase family serine peptidase [Paenibacillus sp. WLX2291]|uniref:prolyl oligopeptidase family serine peptidase n=1 Tax=Paenibacillus sp. WLX2291 TaxID=3296934 RepID=UPI003983E0FA